MFIKIDGFDNKIINKCNYVVVVLFKILVNMYSTFSVSIFTICFGKNATSSVNQTHEPEHSV